MPEIVVDERTGIIVPPDDKEAAVEAFERLRTSTSLRKSLGAGGRMWVREKYTWGQTAKVMEDLYEQVTSKQSFPLQTALSQNLVSADT